jgi:hypothetical protein
MENAFLFVLFFTIVNQVSAQFGYADAEVVQRLKKTKTYIPLTKSNEKFNTYIKEAVEKYWTFTPYEFIAFEDLKKYSKSEDNSFLIVSSFAATTSTGSSSVSFPFYDGKPMLLRVPIDRSYAVYGTTALTFQLGGKRFGNLRNWHIFCYAGLGSLAMSSAKLHSYIPMIHKTLALVQENELDEIRWSEAKKYYSKEFSLKDKKIIFWEGDIPIQKAGVIGFKEDETYLSEKATAAILKHPFEIVNEEELAAKLKEQNSNYLFFNSYVEGSFNVIFLYDALGGVYFYNSNSRLVRPETTQWWKAVLETINEHK